MSSKRARSKRRASQRPVRVSSAHHGNPREFAREASARRARRGARSRAPGSCLPVAQADRLKYLAPLNVRMSFSGIETSRAKRPAESSVSDVYASARVPTTAPPRRPLSARATSRPPPSPRATPPGASPSPFSDAHRLARAGRRGLAHGNLLSVFSSKRDVERAAAPSRIPPSDVVARTLLG